MPYKDPEKRRTYSKKYGATWYAKNRKKVMEATANNKRKGRDRWIEFKAAQKCTQCGLQHPAVIDFHHVIRENKQSVHKLAANGSFRKARKEAEEKCVPLCANCHRMLHFEEIELAKLERKARRQKKQKKKKGAEAP
jgi:hypothetical protein